MGRSSEFEMRQGSINTTNVRVRLADYVARRIAEHGVRHVFMLTGGGAMHLNDALGRAEGLHYVCCHHEQAAAMAAESYARLSGRMAAVNVTTGPGGINALNGVHGAYTDSIPMIVLSPYGKGNHYHNWTYYTHSSTLRTIQEIFGVYPLMRYASSANDLRAMFSVFP